MSYNKQLIYDAAKAAGWTVDEIVEYNGGLVVHLNEPEATAAWQPLDDDGDAFRLAVKLGILIYADDFACERDGMAKATWVGQFECNEFYNGDKYAATRLAIVRVAAEIGKLL